MKSQAIFLIKIKDGTLDTAVQEMSNAGKVEKLYYATGAFDIIALVNAETITQIVNYASALRETDYIDGIATIYISPVKNVT